MDYQNAEFYKLNKNNPDLIFNYATGTVTYRKEATPKGKIRIVEYRKDYDKKGTTRRVVPSHEFSVEDFDIWKQKLVDEALEYRRHDDLTTRENVNIENLLETDLVCEESVEDEYIREEEERQALPKTMSAALDILKVLTPKQRERYIKSKAYGMSTYDIAAEEGCDQKTVWESICAAEKRLEKERIKRGYRN
jgi:hypothetical protein